MTKYIIKRVLMTIPIVLAVILVVYLLLYALPGSTIRFMSIHGDGDALDSLYYYFNLRANLFTRYIRYCYDVFVNLDFGRAGEVPLRVAQELGYRTRNTLFILLSGVGVTAAVGIPLGVVAALRKNRVTDRIFIALVFSSVPVYVVALLLTIILVVRLRLVPLFSIDYRSPTAFFLPALTIMLGGVSAIARMTRASMIEVLQQPYITTLRAKGLKENEVIWIHALRNAMIPTVSVLGGLVAQLLFGTLVVENFFMVPGLGSLMLSSVFARNHFVVLGCTVIITVILLIVNTLSDILNAFLNPQIRKQYIRPSRNRPGKEAAV
jgi:peptide/nickel transport system permease protein